MESQPTTIAELLQSTMIGDTSTIRNAQNSLLLLQNDPNFITHLFLIPRQPTIPYNIQKSAIVYAKSYARHCYESVETENKVVPLSEALINFMADNSIALTFRKYAASVLNFILLSDKQSKVRTVLFSNVLPFLQKTTQEQGNNANFIFLGLYIQVLLSSSPHITRQIIIFFRSAFMNFVDINIKLLNNTFQVLRTESRQHIVDNLNALKIYSHAFKLFARKFPVVDQETAKMLYNEELNQLINKALQLNMKDNEINSVLIYQKQGIDMELAEIFHAVKSDYVAGLKNILRALITIVKDPKMLQTNSIIKKPMLIPLLITSIENTFNFIPYHNIKSTSLIRLIEQIYDTLLVAAKCNIYYNNFMEYKTSLIEGCLFKTLLLNENDFENYFYMPEQFINSLIQVIDKDSTGFIRSRKNENGYEDEQQTIENYDNLRTVAATLLGEVCIKLDGLLTQVFKFCFGVFNKTIQSNLPQSLLLTTIGVLRDHTSARVDIHNQVMELLIKLVNCSKVPEKVVDPEDLSVQRKQQNCKLAVTLVVLMKYINTSKDLSSELLSLTFDIVSKILSGEHLAQSLKLIGFDLVHVLCQFSDEMGVKFLIIFNSLIQANVEDLLIDKLLQSLYEIFKLCDEQFAKNEELIKVTVNNLVQIILREVKKPAMNKFILTKAWNVITGISENDTYIPRLIPHIENAILPLIPYADGQKSNFEENILLIMSSFIKRSKQITQNQLQMFDIIPKLFYSSYEKIFCHSFDTLQAFIFYGKDILSSTPKAMKTIIEMGITSMNMLEGKDIVYKEADNCEGVLVLQSLILSCGKSFDNEMWMVIMNSLSKRIENPVPKTNFLKANLLGAISLVLTLGYNNFSEVDNEVFLNKILQNSSSLSVDYASKLLIISLSEMIVRVDQPFILKGQTYIFDCLIELLEGSKNNSFLFKQKRQSVEERDYENSLRSMKNEVMEMDQLEHFKKRVFELKEKCPKVLQKVIFQLPQLKKDCLKQLLSTIKVLNEKRVTFKIKRGP